MRVGVLLGDGGREEIELVGCGFAPQPKAVATPAPEQQAASRPASPQAGPTGPDERARTPAAQQQQQQSDAVEVAVCRGRIVGAVAAEEPTAEAAQAAAVAAADRDWVVWRGLSSAPSAGMAGRLALVDHDLVSLGVTPVRVGGGGLCIGTWADAKNCAAVRTWTVGVLVHTGRLRAAAECDITMLSACLSAEPAPLLPHAPSLRVSRGASSC